MFIEKFGAQKCCLLDFIRITISLFHIVCFVCEQACHIGLLMYFVENLKNVLVHAILIFFFGTSNLLIVEVA